MRSRTIGIVCTSPGFGGLELSTLKLACALQAYGWQIRMLVSATSPLFREACQSEVEVATLQQFGGAESATTGVLKKWMEDAPASILFTPYNKDIKPLSVYKRFFNRKLRLVYQQQMKVGVRKRDLIHRLRYNMLDLWISPLPYLKEETMARTHVPAAKILVIPLGVDADSIVNTTVTQAEARANLQLPADAHILGVLGRIDPKKGQDFAIRALAQLKKVYQRQDHLLVMGNVTLNEGDVYNDHLHELVRRYGLEDRVHFRNHQANVNLFYQAIDVFLMPAHGETFGMVTVEAMLAGRPVVGVNADGTAALLEAGRLGLLHELEDIDGFCRQLVRASQTEVIADMVGAAQSTALERYVGTRTVREIHQALSDLLK